MVLQPKSEFYLTLGAGSSAIDFTQLGPKKWFGTELKTESELEISVFYLVPKDFKCPNWVKSIDNCRWSGP